MYPSILSPRTAQEAFTYVPESATDCYMQVKTSSARAKFPYAQHAFLELRSYVTGKRRKLTTGQMIIPLCSTTNNQNLLEACISAGTELAKRLNKFIANNWAKQNGCAAAIVGAEHPLAYSNGNWNIDAVQWIEEFCADMYLITHDRIAFRRPEFAVHFRVRWAGRT